MKQNRKGFISQGVFVHSWSDSSWMGNKRSSCYQNKSLKVSELSSSVVFSLCVDFHVMLQVYPTKEDTLLSRKSNLLLSFPQNNVFLCHYFSRYYTDILVVPLRGGSQVHHKFKVCLLILKQAENLSVSPWNSDESTCAVWLSLKVTSMFWFEILTQI